MVVRLRIADEEIELLPQRALHWPAAETLFLADAHLGKAAAFRAAGVPVPERTTSADLARLDAALAATGARRLIVLGDLLHAPSGRTAALAALKAWRTRHRELEILLVRGNHDRSAGDPPPRLGIRCVDPGRREGPFALHHEPEAALSGDAHALAGHVHPAVLLAPRRGGHRGGARLPAFVVGPHRTLLPAFGGFTGCQRVRLAPDERAYVIADGEVLGPV